MRVAHLVTESRIRPLGLDRRPPLLGWTLQGDRRNQSQTAYQIAVATTRRRLLADRLDVWDSGKVASDESNGIEFQGPALLSGHRYYWRVKAWDEGGSPTAWSASSWWQMGLLDADEWRGSWIGSPSRAGLEVSFEGASWIWAAEEGEAGQPYCLLRGRLLLPERPIERAMLGWSASRGIARAWVNGKGPWRTYVPWEPTQVDVTRVLHPGENLITVRVPTGPERDGLIARIRATYDDGAIEDFFTDDTWRARHVDSSGWEESDAGSGAWRPVRKLAPYGADGWPTIRVLRSGGPSPYLRKEFDIPAPVRRATLYVAALGLSLCRINGRAVGSDRLSPGWTDYSRRVPSVAHDVTPLLRPGANAIGVVLGDGWYAGHVGMFPRGQYGVAPALVVQLNVDLSDGRRAEIVSDGTWRVAEGPIQSSDLLMGEHYDARRELGSWSDVGFDDSLWSAADVQRPKVGRLVAQSGPPTRVVRDVAGTLVSNRPGTVIVDFGENLAGWCRLRVTGPRGSEVTLRHGEMLTDDGALYTANLRNASQTDRFVLQGGPTAETFEPSFTYHGFRYAELTGDPEVLTTAVLTARVATALSGPMNRLYTSNRLVNRLDANIGRSQRANSISVPTDCPQRDERLGWTGDSVVFATTGAYHFDVQTFYRKWLDDVSDAQLPSGAVPDVVPRVGFLDAGNAGWGDAVVVVPWMLYLMYGDRRVLLEHFEPMQRWLAYLEANSVGFLRPAVGPGDWLAFDEPPKDLVATAYFARSADLVSRVANVLGDHARAALYADLGRAIRVAFVDAFTGADGRITAGTQSAYTLALAFELLPSEQRSTCARLLVADIERRGDHLSTGFLATPELLPVLSATGYAETAIRLLLQDTLPSWLFSVQQGATSIWERWDGWTPNGGFADEDMNSFNHWSLASVGEWLFSDLAGIRADPQDPGFKVIRIRPHPSRAFRFVRARVQTVRGPVATSWSRAGNAFSLRVEIPANTQAVITVPTSDRDSIVESGRPCAVGNGIRGVRAVSAGTEVRVGSGSYDFVSELVLPDPTK